jgi:TPR repeat protein
MSFVTRATLAAFIMFAPLSAARAQAPAQTSTQATTLPPDNDIYSVRESAAAGDAQAQFALGNLYFSGVGVPQDYGQALLWFTRSANQGFAPAQNQLGYMYQHKFGVPRDYKRAVAYYRSAAKQGYALGQYNVGGVFEDGVVR